MIRELHIRNFALIEQLDVDFFPGFSVITGETGAGKSIILGALGLLLGNRADLRSIKEGAQKCTIEATFDISAYGMEAFFNDNDIEYDAAECILRREINASGKSRAFINDTPVPLTVIRELGEQLIDIHSQHQNLLLSHDDFQLSVVDIIAKDAKEKDKYQKAFKSYHEASRKLEETRRQIEENAQNLDFIRYQYEELANLNLAEGEQEELEAQSTTMQHAEDIKSALYDADQSLDEDDLGVLSRLHNALSKINSITRVYPQAEEIAGRLDSCYIDLKDISAEISGMLSDVDFDPAEADRVNSRLDSIYTMQRKHHADSVEALIQLQESFRSQLDSIEGGEDALADLERQVAQYKASAEAEAKKLTALREKAARIVEKQMAEHLKPLGLPNVRFSVDIQPKQLTADGADQIRFLFSANPGTPLREVSEIASGGEIARVMLSLKALISGAVKLPTIIFDEIDTGVSGRVAEQMAFIMQQMGQQERQVISITHLPQIAAVGEHQYKVYKKQDSTSTQSHMQLLSHSERIEEIAQMLSGSSVTEAARKNAEELLMKSNTEE